MGLAGARIPTWTCEPPCSSSAPAPLSPATLPGPREARQCERWAGLSSAGRCRLWSPRAGRPPLRSACVWAATPVLRADTGHGVVRCRRAQVSA